jgi:hypothetical protein
MYGTPTCARNTTRNDSARMPSNEGMTNASRFGLARAASSMRPGTIAVLLLRTERKAAWLARSNRRPYPLRLGSAPLLPTFVKKLILLSVIIASIALPARVARMQDGKEGLKKALIQVVIFEFIYMILITQVWFRM